LAQGSHLIICSVKKLFSFCICILGSLHLAKSQEYSKAVTAIDMPGTRVVSSKSSLPRSEIAAAIEAINQQVFRICVSDATKIQILSKICLHI
jgi:hypothetical protein